MSAITLSKKPAAQPDTSALVRASGSFLPSREEINQMMELARHLLQSGFLPEAIKKPEAALAIMCTARELGIGPMLAFRTIDVIQGTPALRGKLMLALVRRSAQGYIKQKIRSADRAVVVSKRADEPETEYEFTMDEAKALGLAGKANWIKQPATMLFWRAVSKAAHAEWADVIGGLYMPDELGEQNVVEREDGPPEVIQTDGHVTDDNTKQDANAAAPDPFWIPTTWGSPAMIQTHEADALHELCALAKIEAADLRAYIENVSGMEYASVAGISKKGYAKLHGLVSDVIAGRKGFGKMNPETAEPDDRGLFGFYEIKK